MRSLYGIVHLYSDANDTGYGGYTVEHGMHIAQCNWLPDEAKQSSTWRELVAVGRVLLSVAGNLGNMRVRWFTDNQNVVRILKVGSCKSHLQVEALKVFKVCVPITSSWSQGGFQGKRMSYQTTLVGLLTMTTGTCILIRMCTKGWIHSGAQTFATCYNAQVERFISRYACPGSEAFTVDWSKENTN